MSEAPFTDIELVTRNPALDAMLGGDGVSRAPARHPAEARIHAEKQHGTDSTVASLTNVHKTYLLGIEGVPALRGVSLNVMRGEFVCILGKSGGGKTTMLNMMGTIDKPSRGEVFVAGTRITRHTTDRELADLRLNRLGFVFQSFNLLPTMTAMENVQMPMVLAGLLSRSERRSRARMLLSRVGMGHREDHYPSQLSGGEQQRVTIARALANHPEVLLLDEPTGDLDSKNSDIVMKLLTDLNRKERVTLIMVTHDVHLKRFANRVVRMVDGKINRIETVPDHVRAEAFETLNASRWVRAMSQPLTVGTATQADESAPTTSMTTVRQPLDYDTQRFADAMGVRVPRMAASAGVSSVAAPAPPMADPSPVVTPGASVTTRSNSVVVRPTSRETVRWAAPTDSAAAFEPQSIRSMPRIEHTAGMPVVAVTSDGSGVVLSPEGADTTS